MARQRENATSAKFLNLGIISEEERVFLFLVAFAGMSQADGYKMAFGKNHVSMTTASAAASKLLADSRLQASAWRLYEYHNNGLIKFNVGVLKSADPKFSRH